jgi:hypothetical protein
LGCRLKEATALWALTPSSARWSATGSAWQKAAYEVIRALLVGSKERSPASKAIFQLGREKVEADSSLLKVVKTGWAGSSQPLLRRICADKKLAEEEDEACVKKAARRDSSLYVGDGMQL